MKTRMKHHYPDCQGGPTCNCDEREREEIEREKAETSLNNTIRANLKTPNQAKIESI